MKVQQTKTCKLIDQLDKKLSVNQNTPGTSKENKAKVIPIIIPIICIT